MKRTAFPAGIYLFFNGIKCAVFSEFTIKDIRTTSLTSLTSFWCLYCYCWTYFTYCPPSDTMVDLEKVNVDWDSCNNHTILMITKGRSSFRKIIVINRAMFYNQSHMVLFFVINYRILFFKRISNKSKLILTIYIFQRKSSSSDTLFNVGNTLSAGARAQIDNGIGRLGSPFFQVKPVILV